MSNLVINIILISVLYVIFHIIKLKNKRDMEWWEERRADERRRLMRHLELYEREQELRRGQRVADILMFKKKMGWCEKVNWQREGF